MDVRGHVVRALCVMLVLNYPTIVLEIGTVGRSCRMLATLSDSLASAWDAFACGYW
jgi:hypothetical protein